MEEPRTVAKSGRGSKGRRVLSFDVGQRNLAYCMIYDRGPPANDDAAAPTASARKDPVGAPEDEDDVLRPMWENTEAPVAVDEGDWARYEIEHWETVDTLTESGSKATRSRDVTAEDTGRHVLRALHARRHLLDGCKIDAIVIERQPRRSDKMRMLAYVIMSFYFMHYLDRDARPPAIKLIHAANKLKVGTCFEESGTDATARPSKRRRSAKDDKEARVRYRENKKRAIQQCREILARSPANVRWIDGFERSRKKDDYADSLLQGLYYLRNHFAR